MRLFAKLDRRHRHHPVKKMHGYTISRHALENLVKDLTGTVLEERAEIPGMNPERTHSIVGGAVVALALLEHSGAQRIMLSGQGLREGLARNPHDLPLESAITLPPPSTVRLNTLNDLSQRFAPRYSQRGPRRSELARRIAEQVWCGRASLLVSSLQCAAFLLDVGSAVDFYNRLNRTASLGGCFGPPGFQPQGISPDNRHPARRRRDVGCPASIAAVPCFPRTTGSVWVRLPSSCWSPTNWNGDCRPTSLRMPWRFLPSMAAFALPLRPGPRRRASPSATGGSRNSDSLFPFPASEQ